MCINQCEKPITIAFCQANKNRNVIPVRVDTDQSSSSVSHWRAFSVSLLAETHFDDLKGRLCFFHYSNISGLDISVRPEHPLMSAVALPACRKPAPRMHWNIYAGLFLLQGIFLLLLYFWCNIVQIHLVELFINWNKVTEHRSAQASSYHLKHLWHSILCVCVFLHFRKMPMQHDVGDIKENIKD